MRQNTKKLCYFFVQLMLSFYSLVPFHLQDTGLAVPALLKA